MKKVDFNFNYILFVFLALGFIFIADTYFGEYGLRISINIAIFIILAISYNLINGVTGQFSLEPNGFVAVGAYVGALLLLDSDAKIYQFDAQDPSPFILALHVSNFICVMIISGICATILSLILALPVFRVRGDYLAIVTLGFGFIITLLAINFPSFTNGSLGLNNIMAKDENGDYTLRYTNIFYAGITAIVAVIIILNIVYSKFGRAMKAVRDDEDAANAMGINTFKIKTLAFGISAFFEGVGGALLVGLLGSVSPEQFTFMLTFQLLIIIVLGGLGSTSGAILGTILVIGGGEWLRFLDRPMFGYPAMPGLRMVVFSIILILVMILARQGIMGQLELNEVIKKISKRLKK